MPIFPSEPIEALVARERAALGAAILDHRGHQANILSAMLTEDDFIAALHRAVYTAIRALVARNAVPLEYNSVVAEMIRQETFQSYANGYSLVSSLGEDIFLCVPMMRRVEEIKAASAAYKSSKTAANA